MALKEKRDLICYALLVHLDESKEKNAQAIHFSSLTGKMYCIYFKSNSIFQKPLVIIPTNLKGEKENRFETLMLNKNIERVVNECLDCIIDDNDYYLYKKFE
jgi:hypothetical protein